MFSKSFTYAAEFNIALSFNINTHPLNSELDRFTPTVAGKQLHEKLGSVLYYYYYYVHFDLVFRKLFVFCVAYHMPGYHIEKNDVL